jgi:hypothetical protein
MLILTKMLTGAVLQGGMGFIVDSVTQRLEIMASNRKFKRKASLPTLSGDIVESKDSPRGPMELSPVKSDIQDPAPPSTAEVQQYDLGRAVRFAAVGGLFVGPFAIIRFTLLDYYIPGQRLFPDVLLKAAINNFFFLPLVCAAGLALNEYYKPGSSFENVVRRVRQEFLNILIVSMSSRLVVQYFIFLAPTAMSKFIVGLCVTSVVNIFASWRTNVQLVKQ